jgi:hypothetical protein
MLLILAGRCNRCDSRRCRPCPSHCASTAGGVLGCRV